MEGSAFWVQWVWYWVEGDRSKAQG